MGKRYSRKRKEASEREADCQVDRSSHCTIGDLFGDIPCDPSSSPENLGALPIENVLFGDSGQRMNL
jgi:hypothetical protein